LVKKPLKKIKKKKKKKTLPPKIENLKEKKEVICKLTNYSDGPLHSGKLENPGSLTRT
jgi:hypothetical protein